MSMKVKRLSPFFLCRELAFRKGDIIFLLRKLDQNWFEGERYGKVGIFPINYVEVKKIPMIEP